MTNQKKFIAISALLVLGVVCFYFQAARVHAASWYSTSWTYRQSITINHSKVSPASSTTLTNFPVLISIASDATLSSSASSTGNDILFTAADGATLLNYEIESYSSSSGNLIAWVNIPLLSATADTQIYMYFGNAAATSSLQSVTSTWNTNYKAVYHMPNGTTLSPNDSTVNANNGTINGGGTLATATTGLLDGGANIASTTGGISIGSTTGSLAITGQITMEAWVKFNAFPILGGYLQQAILGKGDFADNYAGYYMVIVDVDGTNDDSLLGGSTQSGGTQWNADFDFTTTSTVMTTGAWHDLVTTYDGTNWNMYIDGTLQATTTTAFGAQADATDTPLIGVDGQGNGSYNLTDGMNGGIDEVRISNTARTPDWIATEYNNESNPGTFETLGSAQTNGTVNPVSLISSVSTDFFVRGGPGSIFGNSQSTHFSLYNSGQVLALPVSTSSDFQLTSGIISPIFAPVKPAYKQVHYHWRNDNGPEATSTSATGGVEDTALTGLAQNTSKRLRMEVTNAGGTIFSYTAQSLQLQYGLLSTSCSAIATSSWATVGGTGASWGMYNSANLTDGADTTNIATSTGGVVDANHTFITPNGGVKTTTSTVGSIFIPSDSFIETEFDIQALSSSTPGATYCFRLTNNGTSTNFTYSQYPQVTLSSSTQSITLTLNTSTVNLPGLAPGTAVSATTTATVSVAGASSGYTVSIQRNSPTSTIASSSITFPDASVWAPSGSTCASGQGNGTTTPGSTFSFRVASSGTTANYCPFWWGTSDVGGTALYAGVPSTTQIIVNSTSSLSQNGTTTVTIFYSANAPTSQKATGYTGGVTITAIANP